MSAKRISLALGLCSLLIGCAVEDDGVTRQQEGLRHNASGFLASLGACEELDLSGFEVTVRHSADNGYIVFIDDEPVCEGQEDEVLGAGVSSDALVGADGAGPVEDDGTSESGLKDDPPTDDGTPLPAVTGGN